MLVFRTNAVASLCFSMLLIALTGVCSAQEPTAEEITQRLLDWQHSFATLRIVYEVRNPSQWLVRKPELKKSGNIDQYFRRCEWIYTDRGMLRFKMSEYESGVLMRTRVQGRNARVSYAETSRRDSLFPETLSITATRPLSDYASTSIVPLSELYANHGEWLGDLFQRLRPTVVQANTIDGYRCIGVRRGERDHYTLWLDLDHDCLPRRNEPGAGQNGSLFHVDEFRRLNNGRWLPSKGTDIRVKENQPYYWVVTEAEVNIQIPDSIFAPPKPGPETQLSDRAGYFGPAAAAKILPREPKTAPANPPPPLPSGSSVTAAIPHTNWTAAIIGGMALLILATILGFWWTRRT